MTRRKFSGSGRPVKARPSLPDPALVGIRVADDGFEHDVAIVVSTEKHGGWISLDVNGVEIVRFEKQPGDSAWMQGIATRLEKALRKGRS